MYQNQPILMVIGKLNYKILAATSTYFVVLGINYHDRFYDYYPEAATITHHITVVVICPYGMDDLHL